jgi:hypothetical protein
MLAPHQDEAAIVAAENIFGVKAVRNHMAWIDPISGTVIREPKGEASDTAA